jgi:PAS domain S-box-containing protein
VSMILPALWLLLAVLGVVAFFHFRRRSSTAAPPPQQLEPLDRLLRSTFERSPVGLGFVDSAGAWMFVNKRLATLLGYNHLELLNVPMRMLTHADDRKRETAMLAALRGGKSMGYALVKRLHRKSGEYRLFRVQMIRSGDAQAGVFQCTVEEVAQQHTSMDQIVTALQSVEEAAVVHCDESGTITGWTRGAERLFGHTEAQVLGRPWHALHGMHHTEVSDLLADAAQTGKLEQTVTRKRADGSEIRVVSTIVPYSQMQSTGFIEICREADAAPQFSRLLDENQALAAAFVESKENEATQETVIASLRASNTELSRKLRVLASGIRKLMAEREAAGMAPRLRPTTDPATTALEAPAILPAAGNLDDALHEIVEHHRTGTLQISADDGEQRLVFVEGRLVAFTSGRQERFLGQLLVDAGIIDEQQRVAALADHRESGRPFGSSLVHLGLATAADVASVIRSKAQRELTESANWAGSKFTFVDGADADRGFAPVSIDVLSVLAEIGAENGNPSDPAPASAIAAAPSNGGTASGITSQLAGRSEPNGHRFVARAASRSSSSRSATYHTPDCTSARTIPETARLHFATAEEADANSYVPCKRCVGAVVRV